MQVKEFDVATIALRDASDEQLQEISRKGMLSLSLQEMKAIQGYFLKINRDPSHVELETLAQTWSEHCKHKTFAALIEYEEVGRGSRRYDNLLKSTIMKATQELAKPWCWSTFKDNAGVIAIDDEWGVAFKAETHNHPSALEPYGGAGTGLGGVIRDILGVGLGAKPVLNTDVFAFAHPSISKSKIPKGAHSPERIIDGVVAGVRDYGNRMGIPTGNGAVYFDDGYIGNPLVFCGTVGILPRNCVDKEVHPGDYVVALGGRTGRDGIHGATFSSASLEEGITSSVVQIGHAIMEKKVMDVLLQARDEKLFRAVTDCGAGGFSSAMGELGADTGIQVDLEKASLKYEGLEPWEIWVSESQERMVLAVPPENWARLQTLCEKEQVEASWMGVFTDDHMLTIRYHQQIVGQLDMKFLHDGVPRIRRKAVWKPRKEQSTAGIKKAFARKNLNTLLLQLLAHPNIASKRWIVQQYDHEVQGASVLKPFTGFDQRGPNDACVIRARLGAPQGIVVANGFNPSYSALDPYWMAACAIDEALRNIVAVGGHIDHTAILDNFCWGDPNSEEELAGLVRASQACYDMAKGFEVPFISGKDSLHNTWKDPKGKLHSIPGSLLISAISVMPDIQHVVSSDLKQAGDLIYLVGATHRDFGGSHIWKVMGAKDQGNPPHVNAVEALALYKTMNAATDKGYIRSCHDISEGGLAVSIAEMVLGSSLGVELDLETLSRTPEQLSDAELLFSETPSRFLVAVSPLVRKQFLEILGDQAIQIGRVTKKPYLSVFHGRKQLIYQKADRLRKAWETPVR